MNANEKDELLKILSTLKAHATCNCLPDVDGEVRYHHSNCARHIKPKVERAIFLVTKHIETE